MPAQVSPEFVKKAHVRALNDQVVIVPIREKREDMTTAGGVIMDLRVSPGGIAIPDEVDNTEIEGIVVGLGDGYVDACPTCYPNGKKHEFSVKIGDRVLMVPWLCTTVTLDGTEFNLCAERDIVGIIPAE